ncbi:hypothetical protein CXP39_03215 [Mesoplasma syrphidae]|uniref:Uncharacterized protein n=1 Tax=Mesoplasma syrphidae TaxID=225999 RepID=A0A2K9C9U6_9MOLU|nr:hypothetical protein [Mesoplasma syrphidae]AUF83785.1 hypothetical protein CXP39_03215 [Mesoplasma syrphidae]
MKKILTLMGAASIVAGTAIAAPKVAKKIDILQNNNEQSEISKANEKNTLTFSEVKKQINNLSNMTYNSFDLAKSAFENLSNNFMKVEAQINETTIKENSKANGYYIFDINVTPISESSWENDEKSTIKFTTAVKVDERNVYTESEVKETISLYLQNSFAKSGPKTVLDVKKTLLRIANSTNDILPSKDIIINKIVSGDLNEQDINLPVNEVVNFSISVSLKDDFKWEDTKNGAVKVLEIEQRVDGREDIDFSKEVEEIKVKFLEGQYNSVDEFKKEIAAHKSLNNNGISYLLKENSDNNTSVPIALIDSTIEATIDAKKYRWLGEPDDNGNKEFKLNSVKIDNRVETSYKEIQKQINDFILNSNKQYESAPELYNDINKNLNFDDKGAIITTLEYDEKTNTLKMFVILNQMNKWTNAEPELINGTSNTASFEINNITFINKSVNPTALLEEFSTYMNEMSNIENNNDIEAKVKTYLENSKFKEQLDLVENSINIEGDFEKELEVILSVSFKLRDEFKWTEGTQTGNQIDITKLLSK